MASATVMQPGSSCPRGNRTLNSQRSTPRRRSVRDGAQSATECQQSKRCQFKSLHAFDNACKQMQVIRPSPEAPARLRGSASRFF